MTTFFSSIQNYFDAKYEGRYSAIILRELALHEPTSFARILERVAHAPGWSSDQRSRWSQIARALRENSLTPTVEYPFFRRKSGTEWLLRKADLALTAGDSAELLFEIKELDFANPRNAAQLDDYLRVAKRVPFVLLTRFRPSEIDMKKIARAQQASCMAVRLSYDEIHQALCEDPARGPLATLVCKWLERKGVGVYGELKWDEEQRKTTKFLLVQLLGFPHRHQLGPLQAQARTIAIPDLLATVLGNVEVLGEWVREANREHMNRRFSRRFYVRPTVSHAEVEGEIERRNQKLAEYRTALKTAPKSRRASIMDKIEGLPDEAPLKDSLIRGGWVSFAANGSLRDERLKSDYLYLELGIGFELDLPRGAPQGGQVRPYAFAAFHGSKIKYAESYCEDRIVGKPTREKIQAKLRELLRQSKKQASGSVQGRGKKLLANFQVPS